MSSKIWEGMSPEDILLALKSAPKVAGPWKDDVNAEAAYDGATTREAPNGETVGDVYFHVHAKEWTWFARGTKEEMSGEAQSAKEARALCDEALRAEGWGLCTREVK